MLRYGAEIFVVTLAPTSSKSAASERQAGSTALQWMQLVMRFIYQVIAVIVDVWTSLGHLFACISGEFQL